MEDSAQGGLQFAANGVQSSLAVNSERRPGVARRGVVSVLPQKSPRKRKNYVPVKVVKIPRHEEEHFNGYHWDDEEDDYEEKTENLEEKSPVNIVRKK